MVNFQGLLKDLKREGLTQQQVADICGVSQATINRLYRRLQIDPLYSTGAAIVELHRVRCVNK